MTKHLITALLILGISGAMAGCNNSCVQTKSIHDIKRPDSLIIKRLTSKLKIGDVFYFGYDDSSVDIYRVVGFSHDGVLAVWSFQSDSDDAHWFPIHDLAYSHNFLLK